MKYKEIILAELEKNPFLTGKELSKLLGISISSSNKHLKKYSRKTKSERIAYRNKKYCTNKEFNISSKVHQFIIGSLLGDGSIIRKRTNCQLTILHSSIQKDYITFKYNLLKEEGLNVKLREYKGVESIINERIIKNNGRIYLTSEVNRVFNKYKKEWYKPNKIIPDMVKDLQPLGLAIWFMDDGSSNKSSFYLSTNNFIYKDNLKLSKMLLKNFNIESSVHKNKDSYILYIKAKSKQLFIDTISPFLCSSMYYKIIGHNKQDELLES